MKIILLGPPGSGKGTQAQMLSQKRGIPHVSTGDMLRRIVKKNSATARKIRSYMNSGKLVPDSIIFDIIARRFREKDAKKGYVLDGFPRNLKQAGVLDKIIGLKDLAVFNLKVSDRIIVKRLSGRRVCRACGVNYHVEFRPPAKAGACDKCKGELFQRDDDKPAAIKNRLKVYKAESRPLVEHYRKKGFLIPVNGETSEGRIFASINKRI